MRVHVLGTRGSVSVSGKDFVCHGGSTSCVDVELANGRHIVLDAGTGLCELNRRLTREPAPLPPVFLFTHYHTDHIEGLPFFEPLFNADCHLTLYGPKLASGACLGNAVLPLFDGVHFPVPWQDIPGNEVRDFAPGDSFVIDNALVETMPSCHLGGGVAYRITADGWTFAFSGDHEIPFEGENATNTGLLDFLGRADTVLVDATYTVADHAQRKGWGHSNFGQWPTALAGKHCKTLVFTHFSPDYDDSRLDALLKDLRQQFASSQLALFMAQQGLVIDANGPVDTAQDSSECLFCEFFQRVASYSDTHSVLGAILQRARELGAADAGTIYLEENGELAFASAQNDTLFPDSAANKFFYLNSRIPKNTASIAGYVATTGATVNLPDVYEIDGGLPFTFNKSFDQSSGYRTQSVLALPLVNGKGEIKGVLQLINCRQNGQTVPFSKDMEHLVGRLGRMATIPLERAFMTTDMIMRMLETSALRDPKETAGHVWRVGSMAAELYHHWAIAHHVDPEEMLANKGQLRLAAMLHDVGKVAIPDAVLKKPGRLDNEEMAIMQTHAVRGAGLFRGSSRDIDKMAYDIALHHHANWDGSGYTGSSDIPSPAGEAIPFFARITKIVDVYDALISSRCYKEAWDPSRALDILHKDAGTHFDPELVDIFGGIQDVIQAIFNRYREDA